MADSAAQKRIKEQIAEDKSLSMLAALKASKYDRLPDAAFVSPGQEATGLGPPIVQDNRFSSTAKTPVYEAQDLFRGTGTPLRTALAYDPTLENYLNAALTITALPGSGQVSNFLSGKAGNYVSRATAEGVWPTAAKGLDSISGGGKVSQTFTPMGPALRSTRIMSDAQKSAALKGLTTRATDLTNAAATSAGQATARLGNKVIRGAVGLGKIGGLAAALAANRNPDRIGGY